MKEGRGSMGGMRERGSAEELYKWNGERRKENINDDEESQR